MNKLGVFTIAIIFPLIAVGSTNFSLAVPNSVTTLASTPNPTLIVNTTDDLDDGVCDDVHTSLREAISATSNRPGPDTILFDPTVFPLSGEGIIMPTKQLPHIGDDATTIDTTGTIVTLDGSNLTSLGIDAGCFLIWNSSHNTIEGLRIQNFPGMSTIMLHGEDGGSANNNTLINLTIVSNGFGLPPFTGRGDGITITTIRADGGSASGNRVINCVIEDNADDGIVVEARDGGKTNDNVITGNIVRNNAEHGIEIDAEDDGSSACGNTVTNNTIEGHPDELGSLNIGSNAGGRADNNTLEDNIVRANKSGISITSDAIGSSTSGNSVTNNAIIANTRNGIYVQSDNDGIVEDNLIKGNTIQNNGRVGITLLARNNLIYHNNIIDNKRQAMDYWGNHWDYEAKGNYWSDYQEKYPDAWEHPEHEGIWNTPYAIKDRDSKDYYPLMPPTPLVRTSQATDVTLDSATLHLDFVVGDCDSIQVYFEYRQAGEVNWTSSVGTTYGSSSNYSDTISLLGQDKDYEFRAQLKYDNTILSGEQRTFRTLASQSAVSQTPSVVETSPASQVPWIIIGVVVLGVTTVGLLILWLRRRAM